MKVLWAIAAATSLLALEIAVAIALIVVGQAPIEAHFERLVMLSAVGGSLVIAFSLLALFFQTIGRVQNFDAYEGSIKVRWPEEFA
jgi:ABC-type Fe3+ transport system permease subunit